MKLVRGEEPFNRSTTDEWGTKEKGMVQESTFGGGYRYYSVPFADNPHRSSAHMSVYTPSSTRKVRTMPQGDDSMFEMWENMEKDEKGNIPMLTVEESHSEPMVTTLKTTKGGRAGAMTMLGVAEMDANREGRTLRNVPDNASLSKHSSRMIEKLTGKYVGPTNTWTFSDDEGEPIWNAADKEAVPQQEISAGRGLIREAIKAAKRRNLGPQFTHPTNASAQLEFPDTEGGYYGEKEYKE